MGRRDEEGAWVGGGAKQEFSCLVNTRIMRRELFPAGRAAKTRRARGGQRPHPHVGNVIGLQCEVFPPRSPLLPLLARPPARTPPPHPCPLGKPARSRRASRLSEPGARVSWEDPRCRRDGPQTTALTDPKGWLREAPRSHREPYRPLAVPEEEGRRRWSWKEHVCLMMRGPGHSLFLLRLVWIL